MECAPLVCTPMGTQAVGAQQLLACTPLPFVTLISRRRARSMTRLCLRCSSDWTQKTSTGPAELLAASEAHKHASVQPKPILGHKAPSDSSEHFRGDNRHTSRRASNLGHLHSHDESQRVGGSLQMDLARCPQPSVSLPE